jgi:hypothetical protein
MADITLVNFGPVIPPWCLTLLGDRFSEWQASYADLGNRLGVLPSVGQPNGGPALATINGDVDSLNTAIAQCTAEGYAPVYLPADHVPDGLLPTYVLNGGTEQPSDVGVPVDKSEWHVPGEDRQAYWIAEQTYYFERVDGLTGAYLAWQMYGIELALAGDKASGNRRPGGRKPKKK